MNIWARLFVNKAYQGSIMSYFAFSQFLGFLGLMFDSVSAQFRQRYQIFSAMGIGAIFIAGHFYMLEQYTASAMFLMASVRHFLTIRCRSLHLYIGFVLCAVGFVIVTYSNFLSLLSGVANILMVSGSFSSTQKNMRLLLRAFSFVWLIHNIIIFSPVAILLELMFLGSGTIGYYRHVYKPENKAGIL